MKNCLTKNQWPKSLLLAAALAAWAQHGAAQQLFTKPAWLPDLEIGFTESHDDNIFGVSGNGLKPKGSWISTISPRAGFDFAPLLGNQSVLQSLTFAYDPDFYRFHQVPEMNYDDQLFKAGFKFAAGNFSAAANDSFLDVDGSKSGPIYALNQLSGTKANQSDKYRNTFAQGMVREGLAQIQDRGNITMRYDLDPFFLRPTASLLDYNMDTQWHNSSKAPYIGYQNYEDRSDINGGADLGYNVASNLALTVGYRDGSQYQQQFTTNITTDRHYSSSTYNRILFGIEGKPFRWLELSLQGGPDFRSYNANAPVANLHPMKYYGQATVTATITPKQSVTFAYKQWQWVSSTGFVPEFDSSYALNYRWNPIKRLTLNCDAKLQEADYTAGDDFAGSAPSLRVDRLYTISPSATYAITSHLDGIIRYTLDAGNNELTTLPTAEHAAYRNFIHQVISIGLNYKF